MTLNIIELVQHNRLLHFARYDGKFTNNTLERCDEISRSASVILIHLIILRQEPSENDDHDASVCQMRALLTNNPIFDAR